LAIRDAIKSGELAADLNIDRLLRKAVKLKVCTRPEAKSYKEAESARSYAIQVDDYPADYFS
jgi:hypothetical protein